MAKVRRRIIFYLFLLILVVGTLFIIFNEYGLIKYFKIRNELDSLNIQLEQLKTENNNLRNEIDSLKNKVPAKIEQVAREKYNMKREGELSIEVREE